MRQEVITSGKQFVSALRTRLAERIGRDRFELWFAGDQCLHVEDNAVIVQMPDEFTLERIRNHFRQDIEHVAQSVFSSRPSITFRTAPQPENASRQASRLRVEPVANPRSAPAEKQRQNGSPQARRCKRPNLATLGTFMVGENNRLAYTAVELTPNKLGHVSPLFIYGPTGCGKTHLLQSVYGATRQANRMAKCVLMSAEQFTTGFLEALQGRGLPSFRRQHRDVDLLVIDDIQFFAGKRATLVELQHTIDALLREGRQIVVSADRPPAELNCLGPELTARFSSGLVCGVQYPDYGTRYQILKQFAAQHPVSVSSDVLKLIAMELGGDVRQLRGALNRLVAVQCAQAQTMTLESARDALADLFQATKRAISMPEIERAVCEVFGVDEKSLRSSRKGKVVSQPRMLAMWLSRKYTRAALSEIGDYFGGRSHSTVISAQKKVNRWVQKGEPIRIAHMDCLVDEAIRRIESNLRAG